MESLVFRPVLTGPHSVAPLRRKYPAPFRRI